MSENSEGADRVSGRHLRVVRGDPTPEEVAALVTAVSARARATDAARAGTHHGGTDPPAWRHPARLVRRPLTPGPGAWRAQAPP